MALPQHLRAAYELLQVEPTEDLQVVKASYKKLALLHHPDKNRGADEEHFKAISAAYESICKHVKGQDEVDHGDPDFQVIFELFHLFNCFNAQEVAASMQQGYASGGSSCESNAGDDASSRTMSDHPEEYSEGEAEDEEGTDDQDVSNDWEPETPGTELGRSGHGFHHHFCHSEHIHGSAVCQHNVNVALPGLSNWSGASQDIKPEDLELFRKHEMQTKLAGGKKRVESDAERKIRVRLLLIEQQMAKQRRENEAREKKEAARLEREQEKKEAAARRAEKNAKKRALVQEKAAEAKKAAQLKLLALQEDRSKVFDQLIACAKVHDDAEYHTACEAVKQVIADKQIAAHGWERLPTVEADHVRTDGRDLQKTTLLHLAVQASDPELVDWLVCHGARADERDSANFTPLHRALENGDKKVLDYFFETFPPYDNDGKENSVNMKIYEPPKKDDPSLSLVMLATLSGDAEVVDYVLDKSAIEEVVHCYRYAQGQIRHARFHKPTIAAWKAVQQMLEQKQGFSAPPELAARPHNRPHYNTGGGNKWKHSRNGAAKVQRGKGGPEMLA